MYLFSQSGLGTLEPLPSGARREVGASFENAKRFQNSQKIFFGRAKPAIGRKAPTAEQL
jgi:hypothetical protein